MGRLVRVMVAAVVAAGGAVLGMSGPALAAVPGTVAMDYPWRVQYLAAAHQTNAITVTESGGWTYVDDVYAIAAGAGCSAVPMDATKVRCASAPITAIVVNAGNGNDTITIGGSVDSSVTTSLLGGDGNDTINGGPGLDGIWGGPGADTIHGGGGLDAAMYNEPTRATGVHVDLDGAAGDDGEPGEGDTVDDDVESIYGTAHDDVLTGNAANNQIVGDGYLAGATGNDTITGLGGADTLQGGPGNDLLNGGTGADVMHGDEGLDTVTYAGRADAVVADLDGVNGDDGAPGEGDTIHADVENLTGGRGDDTLTGNAGTNVLTGGQGVCTLLGPCTTGGDDILDGQGGNDRLDGGLGADTLIGGTGIDFADYAGRTAAVTADIDNAADDGQPGEGDTITTSVEGILGGSGDDVLTGSAGDNLLSGGDGSDSLYGLSGNDILDGVTGAADTADGGPGVDTCVHADATVNCE
ncbi:calcium-binding protein [Dactylosporangium sp. CS-047395]|uniref:calcium-binding protein n=1 Tax=Dactylosporangium sp. CS-047395 TaxID=3239936 RepID=UPI003D907AFC